MKRGIKRRSSIMGTIHFDGVTHDGTVVFAVTASAAVFREEWIAEMERMLDSVDPPLRLVSAAGSPEAESPRPQSGYAALDLVR